MISVSIKGPPLPSCYPTGSVNSAENAGTTIWIQISRKETGRKRWRDYASFQILRVKRTAFLKEDEIIITQQSLYGNQWSKVKLLYLVSLQLSLRWSIHRSLNCSLGGQTTQSRIVGTLQCARDNAATLSVEMEPNPLCQRSMPEKSWLMTCSLFTGRRLQKRPPHTTQIQICILIQSRPLKTSKHPPRSHLRKAAAWVLQVRVQELVGSYIQARKISQVHPTGSTPWPPELLWS